MDLKELHTKTNQSRHPWEIARYKVTKALLKKIIKNSDNFSVLDIGCGDLFVAKSICKDFPKLHYYAVDTNFTSNFITEFSNSNTQKNLFIFNSLTNNTINSKINLVLLMDVIEHISDDHLFLKDLYDLSILDKKAFIYITVPAFQKLFCEHDVFLNHYRRYNNTNLKLTINKAGFSSIQTGYFFSLLLIPRIIQVAKEKYLLKKQKNTGLVEWKGNYYWSHFLANFLYLDFIFCNFIKKYFKINIPGLSNFILCQKRA
mgnify:FL=1